MYSVNTALTNRHRRTAIDQWRARLKVHVRDEGGVADIVNLLNTVCIIINLPSRINEDLAFQVDICCNRFCTAKKSAAKFYSLTLQLRKIGRQHDIIS